jgi:uncharacterized membrane protein
MTTVTAGPPAPLPAIRRIGRADIAGALRAGLSDFARAPVYGLAIGALFSLAGILLTWALLRGQAGYWILPLAGGFPLVGPFAAVGLYEVSRRLETGEPLGWGAIIVAAVVIAMLPMFLGMILVFPLLGHATWHVYRKVIG